MEQEDANLDERGQTWIVLREGQIIGEVQLVPRERQLGKDENLRLCFRGDVGESSVLCDVSFDVTPLRDRLCRSYRASGCHVDKLPRRGRHTFCEIAGIRNAFTSFDYLQRGERKGLESGVEPTLVSV